MSDAAITAGGTANSGGDQAYFDELITTATATLAGDEVLLANMSGERTDFIRLNQSEVRQAGSIDQRTLSVDLIEGQRHVAGRTRLTGARAVDPARLASLLDELRERRAFVADDPFLLYNTEPTSSERLETGSVPDPAAALADIRAAGKGRDLVGIYASGDTYSGFANSLGQRNWFQSATFTLDWCFYLRADTAAKNLYDGRPRAGADRPVAGRVPHVPGPTGERGVDPAPVVVRRVRARSTRDPPDAAVADARRRCPPVTAAHDQRGHRWRRRGQLPTRGVRPSRPGPARR